MAQESPKRPPNVVKAAKQKLESLKNAGISHIPKSKAKPAKAVPQGASAMKAGDSKAIAAPARVEVPPAVKPRPAAAPAVKPKPAPPSLELLKDTPALKAAVGAKSREEALAAVAKLVSKCTRCAELAATRTQTVFGVGNPYSSLVFVGEAPGADEDRQGEPFVGRAGQLLTDVITKGMKLRREDVYIMNILRCRPPENRTPLPVEAAACREYLEAQLAIIKPKYICCLGACAAQNLLQTDTAIGKLRGRMIDFHDMRVLCTYHPAYILRNPPAKGLLWDDIKVLMGEMGLKV